MEHLYDNTSVNIEVSCCYSKNLLFLALLSFAFLNCISFVLTAF